MKTTFEQYLLAVHFCHFVKLMVKNIFISNIVIFWKKNFLLCVLIELRYKVISEPPSGNNTCTVLGMHKEITAKV